MVAGQNHGVRVAGVEDGAQFLVDGLVDGAERGLVVRSLVDDGVRLLELEEAELRVEALGEVPERRAPHLGQSLVPLDLFVALDAVRRVHPVVAEFAPEVRE